MQPRPHERSLCIGVTGTGKTLSTRQRVAAIRRVVVWAPKGDYDLAERCAGADEAAACASEWRRGCLRVVVVPDWRNDMDEELDALCEVLWWVGGLELVIEEAGLMDPRKPHRHFDRVVMMGRDPRRITVSCVSQRAAQVPAIMRSQASRVRSFRQTHPADVDALAEVIGSKADAARVASLPDLHFLEWEPASGVRYGRVEIPA